MSTGRATYFGPFLICSGEASSRSYGPRLYDFFPEIRVSAVLRQPLVILAQPPVLLYPSDRPLHHPPTRQHLEGFGRHEFLPIQDLGAVPAERFIAPTVCSTHPRMRSGTPSHDEAAAR